MWYYPKNGPKYLILMQPGSDQFEYIEGTLDRLDKMNETLILRNEEAWPNNIIYKFYSPHNLKIAYLVRIMF